MDNEQYKLALQMVKDDAAPVQADIVERIERLHANREGVDGDFGVNGYVMDLLLDAVEEIRALRAEVQALQIDVDHLKADKARLVEYHEKSGDIIDELMGADLSDTYTVGNLINRLWRLR